MSYFQEIEQFFTCPYCFQEVSFILETQVSGTQTYIEDCEVCCRPIEISYTSDGESVTNFDLSKAS